MQFLDVLVLDAKKYMKGHHLAVAHPPPWCATGKCQSTGTSDDSRHFQTNTHPWHLQRSLLIGREGVTPLVGTVPSVPARNGL
jgi:hypothetical protein